MQGNGKQLRTELPSLDVKNLVGTNIDGFHANPAHQRGMLKNLSAVYKTSIEVAGFTFGLVATPLYSSDGSKLGTVVEWEDKTNALAEERAAEVLSTTNARIATALQVCKANVMMADADLNIVYLNDSVESMLSNREKELRAELSNFSVKLLIGTCVDDFHKNPAHQRGMLESLKDTYETDLTLGELTFGLIATPVFDGEGKRSGTVVEWQDKTEAIAAEHAAKEISDNNERVRQALDVVDTATMIADNDLNIIYLNQSVNRMMQNLIFAKICPISTLAN